MKLIKNDQNNIKMNFKKNTKMYTKNKKKRM